MKKISEMTLEEKIGQLVIVGFPADEIDDNLVKIVKEYKAGNIILFARNIKDIKQLYHMNKKLHQLVIDETGIMPFISMDQEGGMVTRIMKEATFFPGNMTLATARSEKAYEVGRMMGEELRALGVNMNLAPSLDVNNNPANPVIGVRSYSDDPNIVGKYGLNYIRGLQSAGLIATAKHFPGHGDTNCDSHKALPTISHNKERLNKIELVPFKKVLNETKAIMSAHIFFKAYETEQIPGTLSKKVITGLLREELGYQGLVVSDCMEMKAIDDTFTTEKGCLMGLLAGLDQVMVSHHYEKQKGAFEEIKKAVADGVLTMEMIDEKVERIMKLKEESYGLIEKYFYNTTFDDAEKVLTNKENKEFSETIVDESLTLVKGENIYLNKKTLVITAEPFATTIAEDELNVNSIGTCLIQSGANADVEMIDAHINDQEIERIVKKAYSYEQVLVCTYNAMQFNQQVKLVNKLSDKVEKLFVLSTRCPYDILKFRQVKNYLCVYEYTPNSVKTIVKYLTGEIKPIGKCPVKIADQIRVGASVYVGLDEYPVEKNIEYLEKLKKYKIEYVFISAHIPEMKEGFKEELEIVCNKANELGLKIILDVDKSMMEGFKMPEIYALRLDFGFTIDETIDLYKNSPFKIELNASTLSYEEFQYLNNHGVDLRNVRISHNFYPKKFTGLSYEDVLSKNRMFHDMGLNVMMYVPSNVGKRPPLYEGLPTVEEHRYLTLPAILSTIRALEADEVFFGDSYASDDELEYATSFDYDTVVIPMIINSNISVCEKDLLQRNHVNRTDENPYFKRSAWRIKGDEILPKYNHERNKFDVTIDNVLFGRYQGEISIMSQDVAADKRVNVVGKALIDDFVLSTIKSGTKFKFAIIGEYDE